MIERLPMISVYDLKPAFQNLLRPLCNGFKHIGMTPNHVTVVAVVLSIVMGSFIYLFSESSWPLFVLPAFLFIRMALNAIDGMMAREYEMTTNMGTILNEIGDVVSDTVIYLPLALIPSVSALPVILFVVLSIISEMAGVVAVQIGGVRRYDGPMGKSDRALAIGLLSLFIGFGAVPMTWISIILWILTALVIITIVNRCIKSIKEVN